MVWHLIADIAPDTCDTKPPGTSFVEAEPQDGTQAHTSY